MENLNARTPLHITIDIIKSYIIKSTVNVPVLYFEYFEDSCLVF